MLVKRDLLNSYAYESVTVSEAVKESVNYAAHGWDMYDAQNLHAKIDDLTKLVGNLLEFMHTQKQLTDEQVADIIQCSRIKHFNKE